MYPIKSANNDNNNCFLSLNNQYRKNNTLINIKNETPRLSTDNKENVFGGKNGKANENKSKSATMTFIEYIILFIKLNFFILLLQDHCPMNDF